jgi:hypothetical protein
MSATGAPSLDGFALNLSIAIRDEIASMEERGLQAIAR